MVRGFKRDGKFIPTPSKGTTRKKRLESKSMISPTGGVKIHLSKQNESIRLKRYKKFIPKVTIKANKNRGEKEVANYTVNLAGRGMYVVGTIGQAKERQKDLKDSVQDYLRSGASFDKDGYVIYPKNKPMTDLNLDRRKP